MVGCKDADDERSELVRVAVRWSVKASVSVKDRCDVQRVCHCPVTALCDLTARSFHKKITCVQYVRTWSTDPYQLCCTYVRVCTVGEVCSCVIA